MLKTINLKTRTRTEFVDITSEVEKLVDEAGIRNGECFLYVPHTTAGITVNEGADPAVIRDIQTTLSRLVPYNLNYSHTEGNADAHIKSTIVGVSKTIIVNEGKLLLGTWQSVFFCEFDGPRHRRVLVKIIGD